MKNKANPLKAAVIVLLEESSNDLILTKRPLHLRHHAGEICFPGGQQHPEDKDLLATALRELEEELGIEASRVFDLQAMQAVPTLTGFVIYPWMAKIASLEPFTMDPHEVAEVVRIPIAAAQQANNYHPYFAAREGYMVETKQFIYNNKVIWGATARIMLQLCSQ